MAVNNLLMWDTEMIYDYCVICDEITNNNPQITNYHNEKKPLCQECNQFMKKNG